MEGNSNPYGFQTRFVSEDNPYGFPTWNPDTREYEAETLAGTVAYGKTWGECHDNLQAINTAWASHQAKNPTEKEASNE